MGTIDEGLIATAYMPVLDMDLIRQLSKYWVVVVGEEAEAKGIKVEIFLRP